MEGLRIALIGCGRVGAKHVANLQSILGRDDVLVAACDKDARRCRELTATAGGEAFTDATKMMKAVSPQAVLVCTPPQVREQPLRLCCDQGAAFFCESPPAADLTSASRVVSALTAAGVVNSVGFMYRYLPSIEEYRRWMMGRQVMAVLSKVGSGALLDPERPAWAKSMDKGSGPLLEEGIHVLDLLRYLVGNIGGVMAFGDSRGFNARQRSAPPDTVVMSYSFVQGGIGSHYHSWADREAVAEIEVRTGSDWILLDLASGGRMVGNVDGEARSFSETADVQRRELELFLQAATNGDQALIRSGYADAVESLALCLAAQRSLKLSTLEPVGG